MKNAAKLKISAFMLSMFISLTGCAAESGTSSADEDNSTLIQSSDTSGSDSGESSTGSDDSGTVSVSSDNDSSTAADKNSNDVSSDTSQTSGQQSTADGTSVGAGTITVADADSGNTQLSSGSFSVSVGNKTVNLSGAYVVDGVDAVITGGEWSSTETDQNVFLVLNGGSLTLKNAALTKTGNAGRNDSTRTSDVSDDYNFYGINSVILVAGKGSRATIENCTITSDCSGANAIFALDEAVISAENVSVSTTGNSSRGVYATYGGTITADHLDITTTGAHCAPVATDRGGGYVTVKNSKLTSSGDGSPNIYSTGEITVENCVGTSTGSQAAVIEGKNSITMTGCTFSVSGSGNNGVMLYQSMSGDAADSDATASVSTLTLNDTTIDCELDAPLFYITNTRSVININSGNTLKASSGQLISAAAGRWGRDGSNGGSVTVNISDGAYSDSITADDISSVSVELSGEASYTGQTSGAVTVN